MFGVFKDMMKEARNNVPAHCQPCHDRHAAHSHNEYNRHAPGHSHNEYSIQPSGASCPGWRLATVEEVERERETVKRCFKPGMDWHICQLDGGKMHGPGRDYSIERTDHLGHMILVRKGFGHHNEYRIEPTGSAIPGWRLATVEEVQQDLISVKMCFWAGMAWYICQLDGGKMHGSGRHYSIERTERLGHMILKKDHSVRVPFYKIEPRGTPAPGWRLATVEEVESNLETVKRIFPRGTEWHVCQLDGGKISGSGYGYRIERSERLGHKILVSSVPGRSAEYRIETIGGCLPGWRLASVEEVQRDVMRVKMCFRAGMMWHICQLDGGKMHGSGRHFSIERTERLGHMIVVNM